jgi:hypothetical protein
MPSIVEEANKRVSAAAGRAVGSSTPDYQGTWKGVGGDPWIYNMDANGDISVLDTRNQTAGWKTFDPGSPSYNAVMKFIESPEGRLERISADPTPDQTPEFMEKYKAQLADEDPTPDQTPEFMAKYKEQLAEEDTPDLSPEFKNVERSIKAEEDSDESPEFRKAYAKMATDTEEAPEEAVAKKKKPLFGGKRSKA